MSNTTDTPPLPLWRRAASWLGGLVLGAVLLLGAFTKVLDPEGFAEVIRAEGLDFLLPAMTVALVAFALEAGLGTALVLGVRRLWVLVPSTLMVIFFLFLTGRSYLAYMRGEAADDGGCGCFGNLIERTPAEAFWQDVLLMVPALLLAWLGWRAGGEQPRLRIAVAAVVTAATVLLAWKAPELPVDDLATRLGPGARIADFCAGAEEERICLSSIAPWLEEGEHLVVITELDDDFGAAVESLNDYLLEQGELTVLSAADAEAKNTFFWSWGPAFDITETPKAVLRPLYRTLPRSFLVRDGEVVETWAGLPTDRLDSGT